MARFGNVNKKHAKISQDPDKFKPYLLVGITSICCYLNSIFGEFVYDDFEVIETNADVRPSSPLSSLFRNDFWGIPLQSNESHKSYRPITVLTFRWNYFIGGLNPIGYHVVNVLLHSVVSVLFLNVCTRVFHGYLYTSQTSSLPLLCGLFFAVHPIHTEAVANVVGRADVLCGLFYLLALLSFINCFPDGNTFDGNKKSPKYSRLWLASCIFWSILSLFSKEQGITVFGVCVVFDIVFVCEYTGEHLLKSPAVFLRSCPKWFVRLIERLSVIALAAVALLYVRIITISGGLPLSFTESDNPTLFHPDLWTRFRTYCYLCALNVRLLSCPNILCYDWSMDSISRIESWWDMRNLETIVVILVSSCLCIYGLKPSNTCVLAPVEQNHSLLKPTALDSNRNNLDRSNKNCQIGEPYVAGEKRDDFSTVQRKRVVLLALSMMVIPFVPASNLLFPVGFVVAERILYIPSMGFCILVPFGISVLFRQTTETCTNKEESSTHEENKDNGQKETSVSSICWSFGVNTVGRVVIYSLLLVFFVKTLHRNSEWLYKERLARSGLKVNPTNAKIHVTLGNVLAQRGLFSCEYHYREALRLRPHYVAAWENLGLVLLNTGRTKEAEQCYLKALSIKPNSVDGHINLAHLLRVTGRLQEANKQYEKALSLRPNHPQLNYFHGVVLEKLGKIKKAEEKYIKTARLTPSDGIPFLSIGKMFAFPLLIKKAKNGSEKLIKKAEEFLRKGLMLKPSDTDSRLLLVQLYLLQGNFDVAELEVRALLKYDPKSKEAEFVLGRILEVKGFLKEARQRFQQVLRKDNTHSGAIAGLQRLSTKV